MTSFSAVDTLVQSQERLPLTSDASSPASQPAIPTQAWEVPQGTQRFTFWVCLVDGNLEAQRLPKARKKVRKLVMCLGALSTLRGRGETKGRRS